MLRYNNSRIDFIYQRWLKKQFNKKKKEAESKVRIKLPEDSWNLTQEVELKDTHCFGQNRIRVTSEKNNLDN